MHRIARAGLLAAAIAALLGACRSRPQDSLPAAQPPATALPAGAVSARGASFDPPASPGPRGAPAMPMHPTDHDTPFDPLAPPPFGHPPPPAGQPDAGAGTPL